MRGAILLVTAGVLSAVVLIFVVIAGVLAVLVLGAHGLVLLGRDLLGLKAKGCRP